MHPKTRKLARLLGVPVPQAIGMLHCLWWWALDYAQDGDIGDADPEDVASACMWEGDATVLLTALRSARFLDDDRHIHDWSEHGGRLVSQRAAHAARNTGGRGAQSARSNGDDCAQSARIDQIRSEEIRGDQRRSLLRSDARALSHEPPGEPEPEPEPAVDRREQALRERRDMVLLAMPARFQRDPGVVDEAALLAEDFTTEEITQGIAMVRRAGNGLPFPGKVRAALGPPSRAAPADEYDIDAHLARQAEREAREEARHG